MANTSARTRAAETTIALAGRFWSSETALMMTLSVLVGAGSALGAVAFIWMIKTFTHLFFDEGARALSFLGVAYVIVLPVFGGLIVGPMLHWLAPEAKGHGVPEVLTAIATRGGKIRPIVVLAKALGSAITIGSGGSVGREGPIVQIGSALGSTIGQLFKLNERRVVNLVACGAAAGISATFNAPIAGVMFSLEVILGDFGLRNFSTIVVSSVTASALARAILGDTPSFFVPAYTLKGPSELAFYLILGAVCAFGALAFVRTLYFSEDMFENLRFPPYLKPVLGGIGMGLLGLFLPQLFGTGFTAISSALTGQLGLGLLLVLVIGKVLATSLTLGSGSSGGVFAPALFIGAVLGGAFGTVAHQLFPAVVSSSGAYAVVGMAAVFAGAARAPITAIVILFEMTQDYHIILPLMFATVVSTVIANRLEPESIYSLKLKRRGISHPAAGEPDLMRAIRVGDTMTPISRFPTVPPSMPLLELSKLFQTSGHHGAVVLDERQELYGIVTLSDLERAIAASQGRLSVADISTRRVATVYPDETLEDAMRHFGALDVGRIPVVDRLHPRQVIGVLRRGDIVHAYSHALVDDQQRAQLTDRLRLEAASGTELVQVDLAARDASVGRKLKEIELPADAIIVSIYRGQRVVVPRGGIRLETNDRVLLMVSPGSEPKVLRVLKGDTSAPLPKTS